MSNANQTQGIIEHPDYQTDAIVSKTIVKKESGTITLFAFDKGQELSEHTTPYDAVVHISDGLAEIIIGGTPHKVAAGNTIRMPANVPHAVRAPEPFTMLLCMIKEINR